MAGLTTPDQQDARDARLYGRALREWDVPPEKRREVVDALVFIMNHSEDHRARVYAAKALIDADRVNVEREKLQAGRRVIHEHRGAVGHVHTDLSRLSDEELHALQRRLAAERQALLPPPDPACAQANEVEGLGTPRP
jgi:hypothetical protein